MTESPTRSTIDARFRRVQRMQSAMILAIVMILGAMVVMAYMQGKSAGRGERILKTLNENSKIIRYGCKAENKNIPII